MDKLGKEHNFTQTSKELTETRNKTKEKLINECMAEQIVGKYCHFSHLFFVVEYATNFLIVTREHKRRIFVKRKYCQSYAKEVDLLRTPTGLF